MKKFSVTERDMDRLLSGRTPADGSEAGLAAFVGSARRVLTVPPDEATEAAHLKAILAAARPRPTTTILPATGKKAAGSSLGLRLRAAAAKVAIGALGLTTGTAGLAMAGVDLPGTLAEKAFDAVGISLPNQDRGHQSSPNASETSRRVHEAHRRRDASMSGCEFGASVSRAARGVTDEGEPEHCKHGNAEPGMRGRSGRGPKKPPPGQAKDLKKQRPRQAKDHATGKGQDGTRGRPDSLPGQTEKAEKQATEKAVTPPDHESNPGNGGTSPGESNTPDDGGTPPAEGDTTSKKAGPSSTEKK
jgi:hypothetical protein